MNDLTLPESCKGFVCEILTHANPKMYFQVTLNDGNLNHVQISLVPIPFHTFACFVPVPTAFRPLFSRNFQRPHCEQMN